MGIKLKNISADLRMYGPIYPFTRRINHPWTYYSYCMGISHNYFKKQFEKGNIEKAMKHWYKVKTGNKLNLENPQTLSEKIQWLKLYDVTQAKTDLSDKIKAKEIVANLIGEEHILPTLQVFDSVSEFELPKNVDYVSIKCNHGSRFNAGYGDNKYSCFIFNTDKDTCLKTMDNYLHMNYSFCSPYEMQYFNIKPKLFTEPIKFFNNENGVEHSFLCFNGQVKYVYKNIQYKPKTYMENIETSFDEWRIKSFYTHTLVCDTNWTVQDWTTRYTGEDTLAFVDKKDLRASKHLDKMLNIAQKLCEGFAFVRVDLRPYKDKIYFGEMTFTPHSGILNPSPSDIDLYLGSMLELPEKLSIPGID